MTIKRRNKAYSVNGLPIDGATLEAIGREVFNTDAWQKLERRLAKSGVIHITFDKPNEVANSWQEALDEANKKIAALEKRVAQLTIENVYLNA